MFWLGQVGSLPDLLKSCFYINSCLVSWNIPVPKKEVRCLLTDLFHQIHMFIQVYNCHQIGQQMNISCVATPRGEKRAEHLKAKSERGPDADC